jgi:small subunit ribosomal protein S16
MRLSRGGSKKRPYYRIVVANSRAARDGKYLEQIGTYNPLLAKDDANRVKLTEDRARYWLGVGAQPTDRVARMLDKAGIKERAATHNPQKGEPGQKAKDRAEDRASKRAEAEEARQAAEAEAAAAPVPETAEVADEPSESMPAETPVEEAPAAETPAEPDNQGVSAEAPVEGAVEPAAEEPKVESTMEPAEGAPDKAEG